MKFLAMILMAAVSAAMLTGCKPNEIASTNNSSGMEDEYTIMLDAFQGKEHIQQAQHYKAQTEQQAGWSEVFVVTKANCSELYWGKYKSIKAAQPNLKRAHNWATKYGHKPYVKALVMKLPGRDFGPPEFNLANTTGGVYTVLVATFYDVPEANYTGRRGFAVEYCKQLRQEGHDAYFYHGQTNSIVAIGLFPKESVTESKANAGTVTETYIKDERIKAILKQFPYLAENGRMVKIMVPNIITKRAEKIDKRSYVIKVPQEKDVIPGAFNSIGNP